MGLAFNSGSGSSVASRRPRFKLVLGHNRAGPVDQLKGTKTGASIRVTKLLDSAARSLPQGEVSGLPSFAAKFRSTFVVNMRTLLCRYGDEVVIPGIEQSVRLEEDVDGSECTIQRGWRIKIRDASAGSFYLRVYEDINQCTCYQCSCLGWGHSPQCLKTCTKFHVVIVGMQADDGHTTPAARALVSLHAVLHWYAPALLIYCELISTVVTDPFTCIFCCSTAMVLATCGMSMGRMLAADCQARE